MPWWNAQNHADRRPLLLQRGRLKAAIRAHFEAAGFTEAECGALVVSPGNETHLHAFATALIGPAVANAMFAGTGKRVRRMPFTAENVAKA